MEDDSYFEAVRTALAPRYRIEREIGHGAYATVFLATSSSSSQPVAVKILKPEWSQAVARERFLREIRVTGQLHHENILPLLDSGELGGFLFFVMPYVSGLTLRHKLRGNRQLAVAEVLRIARQVAAGLSGAHSQGVLHRDIKPENILLEDGRALVADFGIAKAFTDSGVETITSTGLGIGTPPYMSPEQASGEHHLDERSDVYSFACLVYEMLVGETPYTGPTAQVIVAKKLSQPVPSVRALRETLSPEVDGVLRRGLAKVPADRYPTIDEFVAALASGLEAGEQGTMPSSRGVRRLRRPKAVGLVLAALVLSAAAFVATRPGRGWAGGRPPSVVVIPLHASTSTARERELSASLAEAITRELNQWESIRAVPNVSLAGPMFDLGLPGPTLASERDGIRVAQQVRVQAMLALLVRLRGDSAFVEASLIDVARGRPARRPVLASAMPNDLETMVRPIVSDILGLGSGAADPATLRRMSVFPDAVVAYLEGVQALDRGRLSDAEQSFRRAIGIDSTFAVAQHHLAMTLYLGSKAVPRRLAALAPAIAQLSTSAAAQTGRLGHNDSLRIAGFYAFQSGDYEGARAAYATILANDPTDVFSLLLRGTVELRDPGLRQMADSSLQPRGNPNVAIRDVSEILRLQPTFDLGYDHLSEMFGLINTAAERGVCPGFEWLQDQVRPPWEAGNPDRQEFFCPVILDDSVAWMRYTDFEAGDRARIRSGASRFFERYIALVRRWATYAEQDVRPREEMVTALLAQRRRLGIAAPDRMMAITDSALRFAESALKLKADTTPDDLVRLGNIWLAADSFGQARRITERTLQELPRTGAVPRILAANPFLATGQPARAMNIRSAVPLQRFISDPATNAMIPFGGAELPIARIQILGATGTAGPALQQELRAVSRLWSDSRYDDRQRRALRERVTSDMAAALMLDSAALASWDAGVSVSDPLWRAIVVSTSDRAQSRRLLMASIDSAAPMWSEATRAYIQAVVAARLGDHRLAVARFSRLDSLPLSTESMDTGWGFRSLSLLRRADSYNALGDTSRARQYYIAFMSWWASPDSLARPLSQYAAGQAARLGRSP